MEIATALDVPAAQVAARQDIVMRGMTRDLDGMLAVIASGLISLERENDQARLSRLVAGMQRALLNAASLTRDIATLTSDQDPTSEWTSLFSAIHALRSHIESLVGDRISVRFEVPQDLWPVRLVRRYFEFALLNLVSNAVDAMPNGGSLTLRASNVFRKAHDRDRAAGDFVRLEVIDTGRGIPHDISPRIFEPFFTTRQVLGRPGLGLSQVRLFTAQHGGDVTVKSSTGTGTHVMLHLPRGFPGFRRDG